MDPMAPQPATLVKIRIIEYYCGLFSYHNYKDLDPHFVLKLDPAHLSQQLDPDPQ